MGKDKILIVAQEGLNKGGVQTVIMSLVRNLSSKYQFDIILFTKETRFYDQEFLSYGGRIFRISFFKSRNLYFRRCEKILRRTIGFYKTKHIINKNGPYKAIHCHNCLESDRTLQAAMCCGIKVRVNQVHVVFDDFGLPTYRRRQYDTRKRIMSELAPSSIGCSEKACSSFFVGPYQVIVNPFDDVLYHKRMIDSIDFQSPVLIQVGNYSSLKNQLFTLAVFKEILRVYPEAHLNFVGHDDEGYLKQMQQFILNNSISKHVHFYPSDTDIPSVYEKSCYCLLPSRTESFGIVLVEAQAMGLKCWASNNVPIEPNAGGCNYLPINNPETWANAIINDFRETNGRHSEYNVDAYKGSVIAEKIEQLYNV